MILWVITLIANILSSKVWWMILIDLSLGYFVSVHRVYAGILERGNKAARGNVALCTTVSAEASTIDIDPAESIYDKSTTIRGTSTDEYIMVEATTTCCSCIQLRPATLVVLTIDLIIEIGHIVLLARGMAPRSTKDVTLAVIALVLSIWGLFTVIRRHARLFYAFSIAFTGYIVVQGLFFNDGDISIGWRTSFAYLFWNYGVVLKESQKVENAAWSIEDGVIRKPARPAKVGKKWT
ncbi:hypothetical protein GGF31_006816 [Allomyces arbusculus]|nr:hypothetical protein GGF31_006816 [Allomyces arbusculus]